MKFFLLRRFSHLIHRRVRSDSDLAELSIARAHPGDTISYSLSLGDLVQQLGDYSRYPPAPATSTGVSLETPAMAIFYVEERITQLQKENAQMRLVHQQLKSHLGIRAAESDSYKTRIVSENLLIRNLSHLIEESKKELHFLEISIGHLEEFFLFLLDVEISGFVFHRTREAISSGSTFVDAIVDAIREAAEVPHSPWSTLIPAVIGNRSQDHYASALGVTLKTRSDLRQTRKFAQYWKTIAQKDEERGGMITPSASTLSNVQEVLSVKRQQAVDALWSKLRSGELPLRSTVLTQTQEDHVQRACGRTMRVQSPPHLDASSLFMPTNPDSIRPELSASAAASIVTASLMHDSSSGGSIPSTKSSGCNSVIQSTAPTDSEFSGHISSPPRLSLFSSDFWAAADSTGGQSSNVRNSGSESGSSDFTTEDALQSLELIYSRFNNIKLEPIEEASPANVMLSDAENTFIPTVAIEPESSSSDADDSISDLDADFVFVTMPAFSETPPPKRRPSIIQALNFSTKIPRRLSVSGSSSKPKYSMKIADKPNIEILSPIGNGLLSPGRATPVQSPVRRKAATMDGLDSPSNLTKRDHAILASPAHSLFRPTISSSLKNATSPPRTKPTSKIGASRAVNSETPTFSRGRSASSPTPAKNSTGVAAGSFRSAHSASRGATSSKLPPSPIKKPPPATRKCPPPSILISKGKENMGKNMPLRRSNGILRRQQHDDNSDV